MNNENHQLNQLNSSQFNRLYIPNYVNLLYMLWTMIGCHIKIYGFLETSVFTKSLYLWLYKKDFCNKLQSIGKTCTSVARII